MEHFFLYICRGAVTNKEEILVADYINTLLLNTQEQNYCLHFSSHILSLLKCSATYIYVLNSFSDPEEDLVWKEINAKCADRNAISSCLKACLSREIGSEDEGTKKISSSLHVLADALPSYGSYKLDVIIGNDVLKDLSISDEPEFASALYRLLKWHEAHTTIITVKYCSKLKEWCEILNGKIIEDKIDSNIGSVIWRGSLQLNAPKLSTKLDCQGMEIRLDSVENEENFSSCKSVFEENTSNQHLVVSHTLQAIDECAFSTIPTYMISPLVFRVCVSEPNLWNETSLKLLQYICRKEGVALIAKMGFSLVNELSKPDKGMSTGRWKKMVSTGNIKCPEKCVRPFENCFTFVITKSANSMTVIAYPLMDPKNFNADFYFNLTDLKLVRNRDGKNENKLTSLQVPYLSTPLFQLLIRKIKMLRNFHPEDKNECCSSNTELHGLLFNILKTFEKNLPIWELFRKVNSCDVVYDELDPSDWPERVHLLQKQMHMEEIQKNLPMNKLLALGSKLNQHSVSFSSEDMEKYFKSTGEAKDGIAAEPVSLLRDMTQHLKNDFETICKEKWPEILNCIYDDIYYNCDSQAEEKEAIGNQMVNFYVQHETASTCNNQQLVPDLKINVKTKGNSLSKSSAMKNHASSKKEKIKKTNYKNKDLSSDTVRKNLLSTSAVSKKCATSSNSRKTFLEKKLSGKYSLNKSQTNNMPVRSSPRKKIAVNYSSSSNIRTAGGNHKNKNKSQELPELLKKKLRVAVASALENNGVNLTDAFFLPCGYSTQKRKY
ncbi:uncharacterized protein LOC118205678 isoform X2 [Stegodyphus dumicola]|uniref:uncharacterized protein LOC118205678 isoform X2 n=1 Tax=Stegodyphus dumicola TaxID=202533 RepID=UPI0015A84518|nr:uncharacterized protein LOC118205678 isoform X2 [Stegodyphus dumicola]